MITSEQAAQRSARRYYGKYRGTVLNNVDPLQMGRLLVSAPDVLGSFPSTWALPCFPFAGGQCGILALPTPGSGVWIEFEQGDPDFPIWVGCFYGSAAEVPSMAKTAPPAVPCVTLQTPGQNGLTISDLPGPLGGIQVKSRSGAVISVNDMGIVIQNGQGAEIKLTGPTVDINGGALTIL